MPLPYPVSLAAASTAAGRGDCSTGESRGSVSPVRILMWHGCVPSAASHMRERRGKREAWENEREEDSIEMHFQCIIYECIGFFVNNASLLACANIQLHTFGAARLAKACMIFKCMIMMWTAPCICWGNMVLWNVLKAISVNKRWNPLTRAACSDVILPPNTFEFSAVLCLCVSPQLLLKKRQMVTCDTHKRSRRCTSF